MGSLPGSIGCLLIATCLYLFVNVVKRQVEAKAYSEKFFIFLQNVTAEKCKTL